ncbi:methionyl-tRNA formyltransferase [Williamsia sterculiae]|uniref:Methionyl-tRNA formyltransferase n=1 Tax=Williamsia sterculiae TaxID=1344003 RepID=A0A1N7EI75_9NOCA|nr:methionyl-tRNA formyltransferase [Williamsia sterculiae]SIR87786.1 methionyl-tRNA formyltransferase [Williamsia sterculiae]
MRLVFAGTPVAAVPALRALIASDRHEVVGVISRPDAAAGRGRKTSRSPVAALADDHAIDVITPQKLSDPDALTRLQQWAPDCCPVVAYGGLVPAEALVLPPHGWINLHFSILPAWRGAAPVQAAIAAGDTMTGASTFQIEAGLDTGPVFGVVTERIVADDTSGALLMRLADTGARLLESTLDGIEGGELAAVPQSRDGVSLAPKISVESARVRWDLPAHLVDRHVRAMTPDPGAWTMLDDLRVKIGPVTAIEDDPLPAGAVLVRKNAVTVGTADRPVRLGEVQAPGKKRMAAADWARGLGDTDGLVFR